jgi:hypothetical protein
VAPYSLSSGRRTTGPLEATVQRHSLTPMTWTTKTTIEMLEISH